VTRSPSRSVCGNRMRPPVMSDRLDPRMYLGKAQSSPFGTTAQMLAQRAMQRRLTVYAAAGVSIASPSSLPGAFKLANEVRGRLPFVDFDRVDTGDLLGVADCVARQPNGVALLHQTILLAADFTSATPGYAHQALGLLLAEGASTVLTTNYDTCIERGSRELLPVVITDDERLDRAAAALLKAHGCASRGSSLLATTAELDSPPLFAEAELMARLLTDSVVFLGLGSPADYVKKSLERILHLVPTANLSVVDPNISDWGNSAWSTIIPGLPIDRHVASTADEFADELVRAYVSEFIARVRGLLSALQPSAESVARFDALMGTLATKTSVWVLRWLRGCLVGEKMGKQAAMSTSVPRLLLGLSALSGSTTVGLKNNSICSTSDNVSILLVGTDDTVAGSALASRARDHVLRARADGEIPAGHTVLVVCAGHLGRLDVDQIEPNGAVPWEELADAVSGGGLIDEADGEHLIDGLSAGAVFFVAADDLAGV
jgi:hypothetical protein